MGTACGLKASLDDLQGEETLVVGGQELIVLLSMLLLHVRVEELRSEKPQQVYLELVQE